MQVSVIIVNYNTRDLTCACIQSVLDHTTNVEYEIILVDNGSTECDASYFEQKFPTVKLIISKKNLGFSKGNNLGILQSSAEYILLLNSDAVLTENSIASTYKRCVGLPNLGAATVKLVYPDGRVQNAASSFPSIFKLLLFQSRLVTVLPNTILKRLGYLYNYNEDFEPDWIWGTFFFFPRTNLGLFPGHKLPDQFFMYWEDALWCYWLKAKYKKKIHYLSHTSVIHHCGGSSSRKISGSSIHDQNLYALLRESHSVFYCTLYRWLNF